MADLSESDYGMFDYGDGYYAIRPIWLFESAVRILVDTYSEFTVTTLGGFEAIASIVVDTDSMFGVFCDFESISLVELDARSDIFVSKFWEGWSPTTENFGDWQPVGPDMRLNKSW
jgi:hypothetical protein